MDKPTDHAGDSTLYVACTEPAPEGHHTFLPIDPHGLKSHGDPDATMWGANNGLAPYSDRPFTLSALASHWPVSEPQAANSVQTTPSYWGTPLEFALCPQSHF